MINYALPTVLPQTDAEIREMNLNMRAFHDHMDVITQLQLAKVVETFMNENPSVASLQIEVIDDGDDGLLWSEKFKLSPNHPDFFQKDEVLSVNDLKPKGSLVDILYELHDSLQANTDANSLESFEERYGSTNQMTGTKNPVWITAMTAEKAVRELTEKLSSMPGPVLTPASRKASGGRRPGR